MVPHLLDTCPASGRVGGPMRHPIAGSFGVMRFGMSFISLLYETSLSQPHAVSRSLNVFLIQVSLCHKFSSISSLSRDRS